MENFIYFNESDNQTEHFDKDNQLISTIIFSTIISAVILVSITGNLLVIAAVLLNRRLQTKTNLFIVSLATADLCVGLFVMPPALVSEILDGQWVFGTKFCDIWISLDVLCCTASILSLLFVALDRILAIKWPFTYQTRNSTIRVALTITTLWVTSTLISFIPVFQGWYKVPGLSIPTDECLFVPNKSYAIVSSSISFYVPLFILILAYIGIYKTVRLQSRKINPVTSSIATGDTALPSELEMVNVASTNIFCIIFRRGDGVRKEVFKKRERKAFKTFGIIFGVFVLCWLAFFIINIFDPFCGRCIHSNVWKVVTWLGWSNSACNPIIYTFYNRDFRKSAKNLLICRLQKSQQELVFRVGNSCNAATFHRSSNRSTITTRNHQEHVHNTSSVHSP